MKNVLVFSIFVALIAMSYLHCEELLTKSEFNVSEFENSYKFHTNIELFDILHKSSVSYGIETGDSSIFTDIAGEQSAAYTSHPYYILEKGENGQTYLAIAEPKDSVRELFLKAQESLKKQDYEEAIQVYEKALKLDKSYFKTWTNLGDSYFLNGEYKKAIKYFKKAIKLNEIGYQEYWFLADTYYKLGEYDKALTNITTAYMLNPHNDNIKGALNKTLEANNLFLKSDRTKFPFEIKKQKEQDYSLIYNENNGLNWTPFSIANAIWIAEDDYTEINQYYEQLGVVNQLKFKEMLVSQATFIGVKLEDKKDVTEQEMFIYNVVIDGYMSVYIIWEIMERKMPSTILLLPQDFKEKVSEYLSKYVFCEIKS